MKFCRIMILGTEWSIESHSSKDDKGLANADAYTDWTSKKIVLQNFDEIEYVVDYPSVYQRHVMRHEIIHAYLMSSGLTSSSLSAPAWSENEEMVDWFAHMFPRILATFEEVDCL